MSELNINEITPADAADKQDRGAVLLDVREDDEWEAGHAPGARHVPLGEVPEALAGLQSQEVLTVCRSGGRSSQAAQMLAEAGIDVHNVTGGMNAWAASGLPVVRDDGSTGQVT